MRKGKNFLKCILGVMVASSLTGCNVISDIIEQYKECQTEKDPLEKYKDYSDVRGDYSTNVVADESASDDNVNGDEDAFNRTIIAKALGVEENNRNIRFILSSLKTIDAGQIQSAEMAEENGEKVINLVAEDSTEYRIYLSERRSVEAVKNLVTGEWSIRSDR